MTILPLIPISKKEVTEYEEEPTKDKVGKVEEDFFPRGDFRL